MKKAGPYSHEFEQFWLIYPRCEAKRTAFKAFNSAIERGHTASAIIEGTNSYKFSDDPAFRPLPATFLNQDRFEIVVIREPVSVQTARVREGRLDWRTKYDNGAGVLTGLGADRVSGSMATGPTGFRQNGQERITGPVVSGQRGNQADFDEGEFPF